LLDHLAFTLRHILRALGTSFAGKDGLTGAGTRSFYYAVSTGVLIGDQNGDAIADWILNLSSRPTVTAADFVL
jgi:hypothetical protein